MLENLDLILLAMDETVDGGCARPPTALAADSLPVHVAAKCRWQHVVVLARRPRFLLWNGGQWLLTEEAHELLTAAASCSCTHDGSGRRAG